MTEISWPTNWGYTDFCDDIRHEVLGKLTLVGIYGGEMKLFGTLPAQIPRLALAIHFFENIGQGTEPLELRVYLPGDSDDKPSHRAEIPPRAHLETPSWLVDGEESRASLNFNLQFTPLVITKEGSVKVRMHKGDDIYRLGSLRISLASPEEAAAAGFAVPAPPNQDTPPAS